MTMPIDGHDDLPRAMREQYGYDLDAVDLTRLTPNLHTDLTRLRTGGVTGQFSSVYISPERYIGPVAALTAAPYGVDGVERHVEPVG